MSLDTQIYRSLSALPLLLVALLATLQAPEAQPVLTPGETVATGQLLLPLLAAPGSCPLPRPARQASATASAVVIRIQAEQASLTLARCRA